MPSAPGPRAIASAPAIRRSLLRCGSRAAQLSSLAETCSLILRRLATPPSAFKARAWLTLGEVVAVHIDKALIKDGVYQTALARPIVRAGRRGDYFEIRPEAMFEMVRPD